METKEKRSRSPLLLLALPGHSSVTDMTRRARLHRSPEARKGLAHPSHGFDPWTLPYGWLCASWSSQGLISGSFWARRRMNSRSLDPPRPGHNSQPREVCLRFLYSGEHSQRGSGAARSPACGNTRLSNPPPSHAQQPRLQLIRDRYPKAHSSHYTSKTGDHKALPAAQSSNVRMC